MDTDIEYADDANSAAPESDSPPQRPLRKRSTGPSLMDEDRTSREIDSLPSEGKSIKEDNDFCDSDSKETTNGYSVIGKRPKSHSQPNESEIPQNTARRKSRRLSDFFTLPRIHGPTNYIPPASLTLPHERRPDPSRPTRNKGKSCSVKEPVYTNDENVHLSQSAINFDEEEVLNFDLATVEDDEPTADVPVVVAAVEKEEKNLQSDDIFEKMKGRPLPPPPRPGRKPRESGKGDDPSCDYSQVKKNIHHRTNKSDDHSPEPQPVNASLEQPEEPGSCDISVVDRGSTSTSPTTGTAATGLNIITAQRINVSELNVAKLNISEIESSRLVTSSVDTMTVHTSELRSDSGHLALRSVELTSSCPVPTTTSTTPQPLTQRLSPVSHEPLSPDANRDLSPSSEDTPSPVADESSSARGRISSMVPEVGSDEEQGSMVTKVVRPNRRKSLKKEETASQTVATVADSSRATLAELMYQILQICHSSVGQAIHTLLEQVIPEDREKRNEVQAAIWVITIIVAGCLMLGLQSNEKIIHHHHWDFHFPPPH